MFDKSFVSQITEVGKNISWEKYFLKANEKRTPLTRKREWHRKANAKHEKLHKLSSWTNVAASKAENDREKKSVIDFSWNT